MKPAFPTTSVSAYGDTRHEDGMTLRDYFAAKAMQALLQSSDWEDRRWALEVLTEDAFRVADAMLAEREK